MASSDPLITAIALAKQATILDGSGDYQRAFPMYNRAIASFMAVLQSLRSSTDAPSLAKAAAVQQKVEALLNRAGVLKAHFSQSTTSSSTAAASPAATTFSPQAPAVSAPVAPVPSSIPSSARPSQKPSNPTPAPTSNAASSSGPKPYDAALQIIDKAKKLSSSPSATLSQLRSSLQLYERGIKEVLAVVRAHPTASYVDDLRAIARTLLSKAEGVKARIQASEQKTSASRNRGSPSSRSRPSASAGGSSSSSLSTRNRGRAGGGSHPSSSSSSGSSRRASPPRSVGPGGWKNSNVGGIGSREDLEQRIRVAQTEQEWAGAGKREGLQIWRIENFGVKKWPIRRYGEFYGGDCYILLNTFGHPQSFRYDVHYWIGAESTTDERGTAALKTIELDDLLGTRPIQFRECEGHESPKFLGYFKNGIRILKGGIDSGFRHVEEEVHRKRLLQVKGRKHVRCVEVPCRSQSLNTGDSFILDMGEIVYIWNPAGANHMEKYKAAQIAQDIKNSRKGLIQQEFVEEDGSDEFWEALGGRTPLKDADDVQTDEEFDMEGRGEAPKIMYRLCDESGVMEFTKVEETPPGGKLTRSNLDRMDAFIIDTGISIIAWIGSGASRDERKKAILYAHQYISRQGKPIWTRVTRIEEGREGPGFDDLF